MDSSWIDLKIRSVNLVDNPFDYPKGFNENFHTRGAYYPSNFNMQFQALYNRANGKGLYLGTFDPAPSLMNIQIANKVGLKNRFALVEDAHVLEQQLLAAKDAHDDIQKLTDTHVKEIDQLLEVKEKDVMEV